MGRPKGSKNKAKRGRAPSVTRRVSLKRRVDNLEVTVGSVEHRLLKIEKTLKAEAFAETAPAADAVSPVPSVTPENGIGAKVDEILSILKRAPPPSATT
jgi:hypothetical protein